MDLSKQWDFVEGAARDLGVSDEALRKWRERGRVPHRWRLPVIGKAEKAGVPLNLEIFDSPPQGGQPEELAS